MQKRLIYEIIKNLENMNYLNILVCIIRTYILTLYQKIVSYSFFIFCSILYRCIFLCLVSLSTLLQKSTKMLMTRYRFYIDRFNGPRVIYSARKIMQQQLLQKRGFPCMLGRAKPTKNIFGV